MKQKGRWLKKCFAGAALALTMATGAHAEITPLSLSEFENAIVKHCTDTVRQSSPYSQFDAYVTIDAKYVRFHIFGTDRDRFEFSKCREQYNPYETEQHN